VVQDEIACRSDDIDFSALFYIAFSIALWRSHRALLKQIDYSTLNIFSPI